MAKQKEMMARTWYTCEDCPNSAGAAEVCERCGSIRAIASDAALANIAKLPERCYLVNDRPGAFGTNANAVCIVAGESGFYPVDVRAEDARAFVANGNARYYVKPAHIEAMRAGSMFGWHVPGADVATWEAREASRGYAFKPEECDALRAFRAKHGRTWKRDLTDAMLASRYPGMDAEQSATLQRLRNTPGFDDMSRELAQWDKANPARVGGDA